jgi:hypothetical protein
MALASTWIQAEGYFSRELPERRKVRRYDIRLDTRWKLVRRRRVLDQGSGATLDLSSDGVYFETGRDLELGQHVELSIAWPARLESGAQLQLTVSGKIVRSVRGRTAIRMKRHEFRTMGLRTPLRPVAAPPPPVAHR